MQEQENIQAQVITDTNISNNSDISTNNIDANPEIHIHNKKFWYIVTACFIFLIITLLFINGISVIDRI